MFVKKWVANGSNDGGTIEEDMATISGFEEVNMNVVASEKWMGGYIVESIIGYFSRKKLLKAKFRLDSVAACSRTCSVRPSRVTTVTIPRTFTRLGLSLHSWRFPPDLAGKKKHV